MILPPHIGDMSLQQLVDELQEVVEWMPFGLYLGVAVATLKQIQKNHQTTPLCKQEMLYTWMREWRPTWLKVVEALVHIKMFRLAVKIASKYGKLFVLLILSDKTYVNVVFFCADYVRSYISSPFIQNSPIG